jgi:hypothetical protein
MSVIINNLPQKKHGRDVQARINQIEALEPRSEFDFSDTQNAIILWADDKDKDEAERIRNLWLSAAALSTVFIKTKIFRDEAGEIGIAIWRTT